MSESIIIDNGTSSIKAGFSDDDIPRVVIPTVLGRPTSNQLVQLEEDNDNEQLDIFVGEEAWTKGGTLTLTRPIVKGEITDMNTMELIWKHIFYNEWLAETKTHSVIVTEAPFTPNKTKLEMATTLFEKLGVENWYITNTSTWSLYANGKTTGTVVDIGFQTTSFVPIYEGIVMKHAVTHVDTGGDDLTNYWCEIISQKEENRKRDLKFTNEGQRSMINDWKEKICEVADDYDSQMKKCSDQKAIEVHKLPDNSEVYIGGEKYQCPEMLFQPQFYRRDHNGLHEQTFKSIKKCDEDIEKDLFQNVVWCGGSSLFMKWRKKFEKELQSLAPTGKVVKVIAPPERKYSSWWGGAILSTMGTFKSSMFVTKKEWMENGPEVIYDKFF